MALALPFCCVRSLPPASTAGWKGLCSKPRVLAPCEGLSSPRGKERGWKLFLQLRLSQTTQPGLLGYLGIRLHSMERLAPPRPGGMRRPLAVGLPPATARGVQMVATSSASRRVRSPLSSIRMLVISTL